MNIHEVYTTKSIKYSDYLWKAFIEDREIEIFVERNYKNNLLYLEISFKTSDDIVTDKPSVILGALFDTITKISENEYLSAVILKANTEEELQILKQSTSNLFSRFESYKIEDNSVILYNKYFFHEIMEIEINWIREQSNHITNIDISGSVFEITISCNKGLYYISINNKHKDYFKTNKENIEILGYYIMRYICDNIDIDNIIIKINNNTLFFLSLFKEMMTQKNNKTFFWVKGDENGFVNIKGNKYLIAYKDNLNAKEIEKLF